MRKITQKRHHKNSPHYYYHHQYKISTYHHYTIIYLPDIQSTEKILHIHHFHSTTTLYYHYILSTTPNLPCTNLQTNPTILKNKITVKIISKQKKFLKNQIFFVNLRTTQIIKVNNRQNTLQSPYQYLHHRRNSVKDTPPKQHKLTKSLNLHLYVHVLGRTYLVAHNNYWNVTSHRHILKITYIQIFHM